MTADLELVKVPHPSPPTDSTALNTDLPSVPSAPVVIAEDATSRIESFRRGDLHVVRKTYRSHPLLKWRTLGRRCRAEREFQGLRTLAAAGVPCVRGIDWAETRHHGVVESCEVTTELLAGARDLRHELRAAPPPARRRRLAGELGRLLRRLHDAGLCSSTASPRNVLVADAAGSGTRDPDAVAMVFCDQPFAVRVGIGRLGRRLQDRDLFDAFFSPGRLREWSATERWRGVLAYAGGDRAAARRLWARLTCRWRWALRLDRGWIRILSQFARA